MTFLNMLSYQWVCVTPQVLFSMELILRGLQWKTVLIYLDDIIVFSSTLDDHFEKLREVFQLLQSAGLKLKPSKCDLLKKEVLFLGHFVGANGIQRWKSSGNIRNSGSYSNRLYDSGYSEILPFPTCRMHCYL